MKALWLRSTRVVTPPSRARARARAPLVPMASMLSVLLPLVLARAPAGGAALVGPAVAWPLATLRLARFASYASTASGRSMPPASLSLTLTLKPYPEPEPEPESEP